MKIFIVSKGFVPRMHLFDWLVPQAVEQGHDVTVVTHYKDNEQGIRKHLISLGMGPRLVDIVRTESDFLCDSRNLIQEELTKRGQWYIGMDDNITRFNMVSPRYFTTRERIDTTEPPPGNKTWRQIYRTEMGVSTIMDAFELVMRKCEQTGTVYGGFASMENPFFRCRKWSEVRFVKSKAFVMLNDGELKWDGARCGQDSYMSAAVVAKYGGVAVCNWIHPVHRMYEVGGIGSSEERRKDLNPQLDKIVKMYPGLVQHGKGANTALRFLRTSRRSVLLWRGEEDVPTPPKGRR